MSGGVAQIDRHITLVLKGKGPIYAVREEERANAHRRVGSAHYDEDSAAILLSYAIHPNVKGWHRSARESLLEHFIRTQCAEAFLLRSRQSVYMQILGAIITNTTARFIMGGFEILRHDGTYKMFTSSDKQPKRGARIRESELAGGFDRLHVAHTLTTGVGATAGAKASFSESRDNTTAFIRDTLSVPDSASRYAAAVHILFPTDLEI